MTLKNVNLRSLTPQVSELARQAGEKIMSFYQRDVVVEWKKDESPLTAADRASHDFLKKSLERLISDVPVISEESDEGIDRFVQDRAWGHHASCTCKIGGDDDKDAVLDASFRVRGVKGLRVVDASVFPRIPGFFVVMPIYMIAEKAADAILADAK